MEYRFLKQDDFSAFADLRRESLDAHPSAFASTNLEEEATLQKRFMDMLAHAVNFQVGAFDEAEQLVGHAGFFTLDKIKLRHRGNIWGVYVRSAYRGKSVARALMEFTIAAGFDYEHINQIFLAVESSNRPAIGLYERLGFERYGTEPQAIKIGDKFYDDELMVRFR